MTEYRCGSCKELHNLSQKARFCPNCGSTSLNLVVKEQSEPAAKETIGVYTPEVQTEAATAPAFVPNDDPVLEAIGRDPMSGPEDPNSKKEAQPRRLSKRS